MLFRKYSEPNPRASKLGFRGYDSSKWSIFSSLGVRSIMSNDAIYNILLKNDWALAGI